MAQEHALYVLMDSNLPTGGFVASSGLESYAKHGFLTPSRPYNVADAPDIRSSRVAPGREWGTRAPQSGATLGPSKAAPAMAEFAAAEVENFQASTGWYLRQSWEITRRALSQDAGEEGGIVELVQLDEAHEATLLSHVARRASKAQGIALLTLHSRGLGPPPGTEADGDGREAHLVAAYKRAVRRVAPGHLAVCFGTVCAALGIDLDTTLHLYLFTHARSLLSSAVRLNIVGPYLSTQLLAHPLRLTIERAMTSRVTEVPDQGGDGGEGWEWAEEAESGPATTWPLGEILAARHDLQHSRIFNS